MNKIVETPKELLWRVAVFVASAEIIYDGKVYDKDGHEMIWEDKVAEEFAIVHFQDDDRVNARRIPHGTVHALYRVWNFYNGHKRMKKSFSDLMTYYIERLESDIIPIAIEYYDMMAKGEFLPNTPTLMNAGLEESLLSGCYVLPIEDSMDGIFDAIKSAAMIHKAGGGTGFAFSRLRPHGDIVKGRSGSASGPVSFMRVFNSATGEVKQGYSRRGANMGVLSVHHPDILEFIRCKRPDPDMKYKTPDDYPFNNFNISVAVTDEFMNAVMTDQDYRLINPRSGETAKMIPAKLVWDEIIKNAWEYGDPGVIFIDEMNRHNPTPDIGSYESTNPCGEQVLLPYESCNLGAINLNAIFDPHGQDSKINWSKYRSLIYKAVRFLNDVCDMNWYPMPEIEAITRSNRKIGLGVMGFADLLCSCEIRYDSTEGFDHTTVLADMLKQEAWAASRHLGTDRGPFINFDKSVFEDEFGSLFEQPFNASVTTIAPTGTTGLMFNASLGIEPIFYLKSSRWTYEGQKIEQVHPVFLKRLAELNRQSDDIAMKHIKEHGGISECKAIPSYIRNIFRIANEIHYKDHIKMQSIWQRYIDSSISKTINMPKSATIVDVSNAYMMAYTMKCKGITVYRDGCKDFQVITAGVSEPGQKSGSQEPVPSGSGVQISSPAPVIRDLPDAVKAIRYRAKTGCGSIYVLVSYDDQFNPVETFIEMGKSGGCAFTWSNALGRVISVALRAGIQTEEIIKQLKNVRCYNPLSRVVNKKEEVASCVDAIANVLRDHMGKKVNGNAVIPIKDRETRKECPKCQSTDVTFAEGCMTCNCCGYAKC